MKEDKVFCLDCGKKINKKVVNRFFDIPLKHGWDGVEYKEGFRCVTCSQKHDKKK